MKGVVLAGGLGTRLHPMTKITNKHLLPIYKKPMIFYSLEMLAQAGVEDVTIVTGGNSAGDFLRLIGNGEEFGLKHVHYTYQEGNSGIAQALALVEPYVENEQVVVVLGDNILEKGIAAGVKRYAGLDGDEAMVYLTEVEHPWEYGIAELDGDTLVRIIEKPADPPSNLAVIGVYFYPTSVFDLIRKLKPSERGELEITDVNNMYLERGKLEFKMLDGWWMDAGENPEALLKANLTVARSAGVDI